MNRMSRQPVSIVAVATMAILEFSTVALAQDEEARVIRERGVRSVACLSADGRILAAAVERDGNSVVEILDTTNGSLLTSLPVNPLSLAFSTDGELLAAAPRAGAPDSTVCDLMIWDVASGERVTTIRSAERISSLSFSPDGKLLACGIKQYFPRRTREAYGYGGVLLFDIETAAATDRRLVPEANHIVRHIDFAPDGRSIATAANRRIDLWSVHDGTLSHAKTFDGTHRTCFSPDGRFLAWSHPVGAGDSFIGEVLIYDMHDDSVRTLGRHDATNDATVLSLQFSRDGRSLVSAGLDGVVKVWNMTTGAMQNEIKILPGGAVPFAGFGPDEESVLTINGNGRLLRWQL